MTVATKEIKLDPDRVILNFGPRDRAAVWRKLRRTYTPEVAAASFNRIYPGSIKNVKRNKGGTLPFDCEDPEFRKALKLFRQFHGKDPDAVYEIDLPQIGHSDEDLFFVVLGETPAESYLTDNVVPGSSKSGNIYVHPYESPEGKRPWKVVSADGKLIMTLPGKHRVKDWILHN